MAAECPLNMECKLLQILDYGGDNELFVGQVVQAYAEAKYLLDGVPDPTRMNPLAFTIHDNNYWRLGDHAGVAWEIGRCFKPPAD
jgi:flavin reductase (DIM6/NTAB) family NADH-FMN oxidoreductase RutF